MFLSYRKKLCVSQIGGNIILVPEVEFYRGGTERCTFGATARYRCFLNSVCCYKSVNYQWVIFHKPPKPEVSTEKLRDRIQSVLAEIHLAL